MKTMLTMPLLLSAILSSATSVRVAAEDWPQWGRDPSRNMVSPEKNLPDTFDPGKTKGETEEIDMATTKDVKWVAKLGSQCYGNPVVAGGKVFVGTNNETPRDPKHQGDRGILMCLDEATSRLLWQLVVPKLGAGKVSDWEFLGICSSPTVEGDRLYLVTNRCEALCLDVNGLMNGNDGPFQEEGQYAAGPGKPPVKVGPTDADIIWRFDMRDEVGVFPHNITSSSVLIVDDKVYVTTSNGQDWSHLNIPSPKAPALVVLDRQTGAYRGEEASGISERLFHCNWSSPSYARIGDRGIIIFGAGDGYCYGFDPEPAKGEGGVNPLKKIWRFDCNPPEHKTKNGKPFKYPDAEGYSEVIGTPAFINNRAYVAVGQDPEHGDGVGYLSCIDVTKTGEISSSGKVWSYSKISRSLSTASISDGLLFIGDYSGKVHCLNADTGQVYWVHDTGSHIWSSTLVADGKVYIGNEEGLFTILAATNEEKVIRKIHFGSPIYSTPVVANGVLYVATPTHLYAIGK